MNFFSLPFRVQGLPRRAGDLDSGGPEHPAVHVIASHRVKQAIIRYAYYIPVPTEVDGNFSVSSSSIYHLL